MSGLTYVKLLYIHAHREGLEMKYGTIILLISPPPAQRWIMKNEPRTIKQILYDIGFQSDGLSIDP